MTAIPEQARTAVTAVVTGVLNELITHLDREMREHGNYDSETLRKALALAAGEAVEAAAPHLVAGVAGAVANAALIIGDRDAEIARLLGQRAAGPDLLAARWRTGRRNGHTIYAQLGPEPSDDDPFVGSLNTPEAAAEVVAAQNADRSAKRLVGAAWDDGARAERERIAQAAAEMATTLTRPGLGNGPLHGEQVRMVRLDDLLDLINDDGEERT